MCLIPFCVIKVENFAAINCGSLSDLEENILLGKKL